MTNAPTEGPRDGQKTALVTGVTTTGIGGALAAELCKAGYFVFCTARRAEALDAFQQPGFKTILLDVTSTESVQAGAALVSSLTGGRLDILVNNAGVATHLPALDIEIDKTVRAMFEVNVLGAMRMVQCFSRLLIEAKGTIVNIGSIAPILPLPFSSAYNSTKAALHAYGDSLEMEMKPFGVTVTTIITGSVKSGIVHDTQPELPNGSLYSSIRHFWLTRVNVSQSAPMPTADYALAVVQMLSSRKRPRWFWKGSYTALARLMYYLVPKGLRLRLMSRRFGLAQWSPLQK